MPIYEYKCDTCDTKFEKLVRATVNEDAAAADLACPQCGEHHVSRQYSTFAARANGMSAEPQAPTCGGGMCRTPGMCGMN